jgi:hypothetical protein
MFFIYGRRKAKIKKTTDYVGTCTTCNSIGLEFEIYRDYYHLFWIPFFPAGDKESIVYCTKCGKPNSFNPRVKDVESVTRTPVYLYSGPLLFVVLIAWGVVAGNNSQKEQTLFIADPKVGDVYGMSRKENDSTFYYFLRVARVQSDTVIVYPNTLQYFGYVSRLNDQDYFVTHELFYTKAELKVMREKNEINSVDRDYGDYEGFNRVRDIEIDSASNILTTK